MSPALDYDRIAHLYDAFVRTEADVPFWLEECSGVAGPVLELMCGTGRVTLPLRRAGVDVVCVDLSLSMLAVLRGKLPAVSPVQCDIAALPFGPAFELALLPFQSFNELLTSAEQSAALRGIAASLRPGGRLVMTAHNPSVRLRSVGQGPAEVARVPMDGGTVAVALDIQDRQGIVEGVEVVTALDEGGQILEEHRLPLRFALADLATLKERLRQAGFETEAVYGNYDRSAFQPEASPFIILVSSRRSTAPGRR